MELASIGFMNQFYPTDSANALDAAVAYNQNRFMSNNGDDPIHMKRVDPTQNMRRFYALTIQPTLFGGASVIRNWGRIGTNGRSIMETYDRPRDANAALLRIHQRKRRRGYRDVDAR